jgi:hypothetical protein
MSQTIANSVLKALAAAYFGRVTAQGPATLYAAFIYDATLPLSGGTEVSASGTNYSRKAITNDQTTGFVAPAGDAETVTVTNKTDIVGARSTAAWHPADQPINCVRFYDAATDGNLLGGAMLDPAVYVNAAGITITIEAEQLSIVIAST